MRARGALAKTERAFSSSGYRMAAWPQRWWALIGCLTFALASLESEADFLEDLPLLRQEAGLTRGKGGEAAGSPKARRVPTHGTESLRRTGSTPVVFASPQRVAINAPSFTLRGANLPTSCPGNNRVQFRIGWSDGQEVSFTLSTVKPIATHSAPLRN